MEAGPGKAKTSKDGAKEVAVAMVTATDAMLSAQVHTMDQVKDIRKEQGKVRDGLEKANKAMNMLVGEHDEIKTVVNKQEKMQETASKDAEKAAYRAKAATVALYKLQQEKSQSVVVIQNLAPLIKNKETYEDLEKLMASLERVNTEQGRNQGERSEAFTALQVGQDWGVSGPQGRVEWSWGQN